MEIKTLLLITAIFLLFNALALLYNGIMCDIHYKKREKKDDAREKRNDIVYELNKECHELNKKLLELRLKEENKSLRCSFCGKDATEVKKLIAGPDVFICDECVTLCADVVKRITKLPNIKKGKDNK